MSPNLHSDPKVKNILASMLIILALGIVASAKAFKGPFPIGQLSFGFTTQSTFSFMFKSVGLAKIIQEDIPSNNGNYAVYIENLGSGEKYSINDTQAFPSASLYKLYLMAAVLKEISTSGSKLTLDTKLSATKSHLVDVYGDTDFGYEDYDEGDVIDYSIDEALERVGRISDNFAAIMLMDKLGRDKVQVMADSLGATQTVIKSPIQTSASDVGHFFKLLSQREVVSPEVSGQLVHYLSLNQLNDRIPAGVPEKTLVVHKTGELAGVRHDAGIVYMDSKVPDSGEVKLPIDPKRAYIVVMMSQNLKYEDEGVKTLARISQDIYEYFYAKK